MTMIRHDDSDKEDFSENIELLPSESSSAANSMVWAIWFKTFARTTLSDFALSVRRPVRKGFATARFVFLSVVILCLWFGYLLARSSAPFALLRDGHDTTTSHPFSGAFSRFPRISALPPKQRRMTLLGVWSGEDFPNYLKHFFYTVQLNADTVDFLMINLLTEPNSTCLDFVEANVDATWGGNVKYHCMEESAFRRRIVDHLCSKEFGWDCDMTQYAEVINEFDRRKKERRNDWRPLHGHALRDLFQHPENSFWAWIDLDLFVGDFRRYPLNILSQLSILTGTHEQPAPLYLPGQLTAFNFDSPGLGSAWKKFPTMYSPDHFTKHINGEFPKSDEEHNWSYGYLRSTDDLPGTNLSYGYYPDLQGDDYFERKWSRKNADSIYVVSGRDVLLVSSKLARSEIEAVIQMERNTPIDDLGGIGWTTGQDGSSFLMREPDMGGDEAKALAIAEDRGGRIHQGFVESLPILYDSTCGTKKPGSLAQCIKPHPLSKSQPPLVRTSLIRLADQPPGYIFRRIEPDDRPRGYERKLIRHHLKSKSYGWWDFPPFMITEDLVLRYNSDVVEVFRMGSTRNETLYYRQPDGKDSIG